MKKEDFINLGIDEETAKKLAEASADELKGYIPKSRFDEVNNELKSLKETVTERDKQLEELKKTAGDSEALQQKIAEMQTANTEAQKQHEAEMNQLKLDNAVEMALMKAGAKNSRAVRALLDLSKSALNAEGEVEGLSDAIKAVQKSDAYLFEEKNPPKPGKMGGFHPGQPKDPDGDNGIDFSKMSYSELAAYQAEHPEVKFG